MPNFFDDEDMVYDLTRHQYILTPEAVEKKYSISLQDILDTSGAINPQAVPQMFLDRVSNDLYAYIYLFSFDKEMAMYRNSLPRFRDGIKLAMLELAYTMLLTNTDPSLQWGGNNNKPLVMPASVKSILRQYDILYRGREYNITRQEVLSMKAAEVY